MKKIIVLFILITGFFTSVLAFAQDTDIDFNQMFDEHGSVMLIIDVNTGEIEHANSAAAKFYGYSKLQLESMNIMQINTLSENQTFDKMDEALHNHNNNFIFDHRLKNGEIRTVEVYSCPHFEDGKELLFSIIHDITDKKLLESKNKSQYYIILFTLSSFILFLLLFSILLFNKSKKLKLKNKQVKTFNELQETFINSYNSIIYLKDEKLNYVFLNNAALNLFNKKSNEVKGKNVYSLTDSSLYADWSNKTDREVLDKLDTVKDEITVNNRVYSAIKFPVKLPNDKYGVGAYIDDITESYKNKKREELNLLRNRILVDVLSRNFKSTQQQLDFVLNEALNMTGSKFGYIYLYDETKEEFILNSWSKDVMADCKIVEKQTKYSLINTGIWGEVVRQRKPILVNDFKAPNHLKKGCPKGHVTIEKYMSIPVIIDDKIVAVVGLANKEEDYDYNDIYQLTALMNGVWNAKERRETLAAYTMERNKLLQTLISIGDGVIVVDLEGKVTMLNKVAENLTGWKMSEAQGLYYKKVFVLSHEDKSKTIKDPIADALKTDRVQELGNHAMLTSKYGKKYYLEDSAAPIKDNNNKTMGVVLVFRDVTEKKEQRSKIEYLSYHDSLTGLYNRMFFEEEVERIDAKENLPLSVIVGDINGLKLVNDIFGHEAGDTLIKNTAMVFKKVCRKNDIIARVGGDEFTILLPNTTKSDAKKIADRIKAEIANTNVNAIRGSISLGYESKTDSDQDLSEIEKTAEAMMYSAKAIDRDDLKASSLKAIIDTLHKIGPNEKAHSENVSDLCEKTGRAMDLSQDEIKRLREAGYYHDIGKIVLDVEFLKSDLSLSKEDRRQKAQHAVVGYRILNSFDSTLDFAESALTHHERWDGSGYPKGLKGEEIPIGARIIAVAESYDSMVNKEKLKSEEALQVLKQNEGSKFDPNIVDVFIKVIKGS